MPEPAVSTSAALDSWLRSDAILLHIGVHKTGTTAIQSALAQAGPALAAAGIAYPAPTGHFDVAMAALGKRAGWDRSGPAPDRRRWRALVRTAQAHRGRVVFSSEVLCEADDESAARIVEELGTERVQVLITLRPLEALLPSTWQQYLKSGYHQPYQDWLRDVLKSKKTKTTRSFWRRNDHGRLVARWGGLVGSADVAVLVVDPLDRYGLYRDFESLLGLSPDALAAAPSLLGNRSLSAAEAEVLRRFNRQARETMSYSAYHRLIRRGAALALVEGRQPDLEEPRIVTPSWAIERAREFGAASVRQIQESGAAVFGRIELLTPTHAVDDDELTAPPREIPVDIAPLLLEGIVRASLGEPVGGQGDGGSTASSGLAVVPRRALVAELMRRVRRRLRRSTP